MKRSPTEKLSWRILKVVEGQPLSQRMEALANALWSCIAKTDDPAAEADRMAEFFAEGADYLREEAHQNDDTAA